MRPYYWKIFQVVWCFIIGIIPGYAENYVNQFNQPNTIVNANNINIPPTQGIHPKEENKEDSNKLEPKHDDKPTTIMADSHTVADTCEQRVTEKVEEAKHDSVNEVADVNKAKVE